MSYVLDRPIKCRWLIPVFADIILVVSTHSGIRILRQDNTWPIDRWHNPAVIQYVYEQMDSRRRSFQTRRLVCLGVVAAAGITGIIVSQSSPVAGLVLFIIAVLSAVNYYQSNLSDYFSNPYGYELEVVGNSLGDITAAEATEYAEIIMTRREIKQLSKRIHAITRNNFLFLNSRKHHGQK